MKRVSAPSYPLCCLVYSQEKLPEKEALAGMLAYGSVAICKMLMQIHVSKTRERSFGSLLQNLGIAAV